MNIFDKNKRNSDTDCYMIWVQWTKVTQSKVKIFAPKTYVGIGTHDPACSADRLSNPLVVYI